MIQGAAAHTPRADAAWPRGFPPREGAPSPSRLLFPLVWPPVRWLSCQIRWQPTCFTCCFSDPHPLGIGFKGPINSANGSLRRPRPLKNKEVRLRLSLLFFSLPWKFVTSLAPSKYISGINGVNHSDLIGFKAALFLWGEPVNLALAGDDGWRARDWDFLLIPRIDRQ